VSALKVYGPLTCTELAESCGYIIDNVRPAVTHLKDAGIVRRTDQRRKTQYGRPSIVWELVYPELVKW